MHSQVAELEYLLMNLSAASRGLRCLSGNLKRQVARIGSDSGPDSHEDESPLTPWLLADCIAISQPLRYFR